MYLSDEDIDLKRGSAEWREGENDDDAVEVKISRSCIENSVLYYAQW